MKLSYAIVLMSAGAMLTACGKSERERFLEDRKAESAGFRIQYIAQDKVLVLHRPDGAKDPIDVPDLRRVFVYKQPAHASTDGRERYWWWFQTHEHRVAAPFFAAAPSEVISILARELPGFDEAGALKKAHRFEMNEVSWCQIWLSEAYMRESGEKAEAECRS